MTALAACCLLFLLVLRSSDALIGGQDAARLQFPFQVLVRGWPEDINRSFGTGVLIHPEWVLTTAESVADFLSLTVTLGVVMQNSTDPDRQDIAVLHRYLHPDWVGRKTWWNMHINDIALLQLATPARLSEAVHIAYLPKKKNYANKNVTVAGWGNHRTNRGYRTQNRLQWEQTRTISFIMCFIKRFYVSEMTGWVKTSHICADTHGEGPCYNDGGAPLVLEEDGLPVVVGLFTTPITYYQFCASPEPSVYTRVTSFVKWIQEISGVRTI